VFSHGFESRVDSSILNTTESDRATDENSADTKKFFECAKDDLDRQRLGGMTVWNQKRRKGSVLGFTRTYICNHKRRRRSQSAKRCLFRQKTLSLYGPLHSPTLREKLRRLHGGEEPSRKVPKKDTTQNYPIHYFWKWVALLLD